jgi:hypothetical protein
MSVLVSQSISRHLISGAVPSWTCLRCQSRPGNQHKWQIYRLLHPENKSFATVPSKNAEARPAKVDKHGHHHPVEEKRVTKKNLDKELRKADPRPAVSEHALTVPEQVRMKYVSSDGKDDPSLKTLIVKEAAIRRQRTRRKKRPAQVRLKMRKILTER